MHRLLGNQTSCSKIKGYRGFGGGFGFGTPVVSYAPRPIFELEASLVIMVEDVNLGMLAVGGRRLNELEEVWKASRDRKGDHFI